DQAAETLLQVARNIASFEGDEDSFRSWVFVIAHRRMIDARRSKGRRPDTTELDVERGGGTGNVEDEALEQITTRETVAALEILTGEQREVIILRVLADLSLQQTADVMGKRVGSIKALQRRALANLRLHFESLGVSR
ncbi:MAG: sigma-70 family RNA polymerase sigma factor, partial [Acidimicrobiia bacterium]